MVTNPPYYTRISGTPKDDFLKGVYKKIKNVLQNVKYDKPSRLMELNEDVLWSYTRVFTQLIEILEMNIINSEKMMYVN